MNSTSYMATPIEEVNDFYNFERIGFREFHEFEISCLFCCTALGQQRSTLEQLEQ